MKRYILTQSLIDDHTASNKARKDVIEIAHKMGFQNLVLLPEGFQERKVLIKRGRRFIEAFEEYIMASKVIKKIKFGSVILVQYSPQSIYASALFAVLRKFKKSKHLRLVAVIHDIDSLRYELPKSQVKKEIARLSLFDGIVAHNQKMKEYLEEIGVVSKIETLTFFDYLTDFEPKSMYFQNQGGKNDILFVANLEHVPFIQKLGEIPQLHFCLWGPNPQKYIKYFPNATYFGECSPDEIVKKLNGKFALVWGGSSLDLCDTKLGEYLRINSPHKLSLYTVAGIPLIVWKKSSVADYVVKKHIGIAVDSLRELPNVLGFLSDSEYDEMKKNVVGLAEELASGKHLEECLNSLLY